MRCAIVALLTRNRDTGQGGIQALCLDAPIEGQTVDPTVLPNV